MAKYPLEVKNKAYQLYIASGDVKKVRDQIIDEFGGKLDTFPSISTVKQWITRNNLNEVHKNLYTDAIMEARTREINTVLLRRGIHKETYQIILDKARKDVENKEFRDAYDATRAADMAIQGERKIANEQLNLQFVEDVFAAIHSVIVDENILREIGIELRKLLVKYNG